MPMGSRSEAIALSSILSQKTKIIADCWDPKEEAKETAFPHWKKPRNSACVGVGTSFLADEDPAFSFNYITRNFGLPLVDLVSFRAFHLVFLFLTWEMSVANLLGVPLHMVAENLLIGMRCQQVLNPPRWEDPSCKFLAMTLKVDKPGSGLSSESSHVEGDMFIAFNAAGRSESVTLPEVPEGMTWHRLVDTALPFPGFFSNDSEPVIRQAL
ncbi:hypothetical protein NC653_007199 [Populus alba x Populus x berolinensis]|uniref:Isoamylase 1-3-like C-terminal domain-containing protein n=1 Tax=Populus alba x Populus x berolinensis TaxID=444605 RepID=A0AAD6WD65_9ROSI|nr:hypothetical protein NC653_007199 [Populus alba x Populus x berolinensis]